MGTNEKKFPLFDIYWENNDIDAISKIIKRGSYWADGPEIKKFEEALSKYFGVKYTVVVSNGTAALHILLLAYGITSGEVIVPSFSFIATANAVVLAGAKPIFADIEKDTLGLSYDDVQRKITKNTRAILPMHYGGKVSKDIIKLAKLAKENGILLLEDNAESFGAKYKGIFAGLFGDASILSFCQNKILPTGEGGAILLNDPEIYQKLLLLRSHGRVSNEEVDYFHDISIEDYTQVGYNYRMPTICAALGLSQLSKIDKILKLRRKIGKYYDKKLSSIDGITVINEIDDSFNVYQLYTILVNDAELREPLQKYLLEKGIFTKIYFAPIHLKSYYREKYNYRDGDLKETEWHSEHVLTLPMSLNFKEEDLDYIIEKIKEFFDNKKK